MSKGAAAVLVLAAMSLVSACGQAQSGKSQPATSVPSTAPATAQKKLTGTIKVGLGVALTGPYASGSKGHKSAVEMAVDDVNKSGMLGDAKLELVEEDGLNTQETAINAFQKLVQTDKVTAVFGPSAAPQALAASPLLQKAGVFNFAPNGTPELQSMGDHVYIIVPMYIDLLPKATEQLIDRFHIKSAAIVTQKDYNLAVNNTPVRKQVYQAKGVKVVVDVQTLGSDTDFSPVITKIMAANPDLVSVDGATPHDPLFLTQLKQAGYKGIITAGPTGIAAAIIKANAQAFEGVYNVTGFMPNLPGASQKSLDFAKRFQAQYGLSADFFSASMYDAVFLYANALKMAGSATDGPAIVKALQTEQFEGVQGSVKFDKNRVLTSTFAMFQAKNGEIVPLTN